MDPPEYILLPWRIAGQPALSDPEYRTYVLILSLAWQNDRRQTSPIGRRELAALRGLALRTIDAHLSALRAKGYVCNAPGRAGLKMILIPTALAPTGVRAGFKPAPTPPSAVPTPPPAADCAPQRGFLPNEPQPVPRPPSPGPGSGVGAGFKPLPPTKSWLGHYDDISVGHNAAVATGSDQRVGAGSLRAVS